MTQDDIIWRLAQLSSLPFQERYVINGTVDSYVLDTELIENVDSLKFLLRRPENRELLKKEQVEALEDLFDYIETYSGEALLAQTRDEAATLIREGIVWEELRSKAAHALRLFGLSPDMSVEEINRLSE